MEQGLAGHFSFGRLLRFCLSPIIMMIFTSIYGVVDGFFVSNYVGKVSFAAINLAWPFIMIMSGLGFMVGTGGSALVARIMGEGDNELANRIFSILVEFTLILGTLLTVLGYLVMPAVATFLGATEQMMPETVLYGRLMLLFNVPFMLQNVFQTFLSTASKPKLGLIFTLAAGFMNMFLDWLFIGYLGLGVTGAALATGIGEIVGGVFPLIYFMLPNDSLLHLRIEKLEWQSILATCLNGSSELMSNISSSLLAMLYNLQLLKYLGENGVAAYGVLMYVQFIFIAVFIGYTIGTSPVISFNYGANNQQELQALRKKSQLFTLVMGILMAVASQFLAKPLAYFFVGYDEQLLILTVYAIKVSALSFILAGLNIFHSALFTALNDGRISAFISFTRTLIFQLSSVLVLPLLIGRNGIWWAALAAEVLAFLLSTYLFIKKQKEYHY